MSDELFCPEHGPYPARLGRCPFCDQVGKKLPPAPASLYGSGQGYGDDDQTILPRRSATRKAGRINLDDDATDPPLGGRQAARGDPDDETQPPLRKRRPGLLNEPFEDDEEDATVIDRPDRTVMGWLIVKRSPVFRRGHILKIRPGKIFGRSPHKADIYLDDEKVSILHARISMKGTRFYIVDLDSTNGTWVNDKKITSASELAQDDEITIGDTVFVLKTLT